MGTGPENANYGPKPQMPGNVGPGGLQDLLTGQPTGSMGAGGFMGGSPTGMPQPPQIPGIDPDRSGVARLNPTEDDVFYFPEPPSTGEVTELPPNQPPPIVAPPPANIFDPVPEFPTELPGGPGTEGGVGGSPGTGGGISLPGIPGGTGGGTSGGTVINMPGGGTIDMAQLIALLGGGAAAHQQAEAFREMSEQFMGMGAPYREQLLNLQNDPMSYLNSPAVTGAVQQGTDALARSLSVQGNPIGSGGALQQLQSYATNEQLNRLGSERDRLSRMGGIESFNSAVPSSMINAINSQAGQYDALGPLLGMLMEGGGPGGGGGGPGGGGGIGGSGRKTRTRNLRNHPDYSDSLAGLRDARCPTRF